MIPLNHSFKTFFYPLVFRTSIFHLTSNKQTFNYSNMKIEGIRENFNLKVKSETLLQRAKELSTKFHKAYDLIADVPDHEVSYDSVLKVLADLDCEFMTSYYYLIFPQHVSCEPDVRAASTEAQKILNACTIDLNSRKDVFKKLLVLEKNKEPMKPEAVRLLEHWVKLRKRNGLHLSEDVQEQLKSIKIEISNLCAEFSRNLNSNSTKLEFTESELNGLSEDFIFSLEKNADTGKHIVTLSYPHYFPVMRQCKNPTTRRQMYNAFNSRCKKENAPIVEKVRELRHKHANLLGYPNHASYVCEILMSKSPENVENHMSEISGNVKNLYEEEKKCIIELKEKECQDLNLPFNNKIDAWDTGYYSAKIEKIKYAVDKEALKEYFPLDKVTEGLFDIYQQLLCVKFTEIESPDAWHKDVRLFSVKDSRTSELLGYFFLDQFPRDGKYGHACIKELQPGCLLPDGSRQISVTSVVVNFPKPLPNKPSLLHFHEVETFFNEFGHVMHYICAQADFANFSNIKVERDFLEAPSQMLENWCYDKQCLNKMSSHYSDQSPIPDEMLDALIKSKNSNLATFMLRQISLATFDIRYHSTDKGDVKQLYVDLVKKIIGIDVPEENYFVCSFLHLFDKYDSQYYSYMWSAVYSDDMFETRFKDGNLLDPQVGMDYRNKILSPGASKDAIDMLQDFLGRKPTRDAFYRCKGLKL